MTDLGFLPPIDTPCYTESQRRLLRLLHDGMDFDEASAVLGLKRKTVSKALTVIRGDYQDYRNLVRLGEFKFAPNVRPGGTV